MTLLRAFWDAAEELDPDDVGDVAERARRSFAARGGLAELWRRAGFEHVDDGEIVVSAGYESFDDLWAPFTAGVGPAGASAASLAPDRQEPLRAEVGRRLAEPDGPFRVSARAWYAVGRT